MQIKRCPVQAVKLKHVHLKQDCDALGPHIFQYIPNQWLHCMLTTNCFCNFFCNT